MFPSLDVNIRIYVKLHQWGIFYAGGQMWIKEECVPAGRLATLPSFMRAPSFCPHNRFLPSFCPHSFKSIFCPHKMTSFFNLLSATLIELKIFAYGELNILEYALINLKFDLIFALIN